MPQETITEDRVKEIVQQYLSARIEDVDELRKSPAGRVLIIETEVKNLGEKVDLLYEKIDEVKNDLKQDIGHLNDKVDEVKSELKQDGGRLNNKIDEFKNDLKQDIGRLNDKIDEVKNDLKQEIQHSKNLTIALFAALLGLVGSIVVKMFFFM